MPRDRSVHRIEAFLGENNRDSLTNQKVFGRIQAKLYRLRNYHLIGHGRARKRFGYKSYVAAKIGGANPVQGLVMREFGTSRQLVGCSNGLIKVLSGSTWSDVTGTVTAATGDDAQYRFGHFTDGQAGYLLATDGVNEPWAYSGTGNAQVLSDLGPNAPLLATDIKEFRGHVFSLYEHSLDFSAYGVFNWADGNVIDSSRDSYGVALEQHSRDALLAFYERQVYRIMPNEREGPPFLSFAVEGSEGCISRSSVATKDGWTYYATRRGIRRIGFRGDGWRDEFIGREIEAYWDELNRDRRAEIVAVVRGEPWNEILFIVTHSSAATNHNSILCWNTQLEGWSIWPQSQTSGKLAFSHGCNFVDGDGIPRTIMGDYNGNIVDAFGHTLADTGFTDDGANVETTFTTGFLAMGYSGMKGLRQLALDVETIDTKDFNIVVEPMGRSPVSTHTLRAGAGGDVLNVSFILNQSVLSVSTVTQGQTPIASSGRYFSVEIKEDEATSAPHVISSAALPFVRKSTRMT